MSISAVGFSSSDIDLGCNPARTQRAGESIRSLNAPLVAALAIEQALLQFTVHQIHHRARGYRELADQFDHHQARVDVLRSQVES